MSNDRDDTFREEAKAFMVRTGIVLENLEKIVTAHSNEIWGRGETDPGMKRNLQKVVDATLDQRESRIWWRGAVGIPVVGLAVDWIIRHWPK